ncbi:hypothetical protein ACWODI_06045 [Facklamia languida]
MEPNINEIIEDAYKNLLETKGHNFDIIEVFEPISPDSAVNLSKTISKLSSFMGNLIEFNIIEYLNDSGTFKNIGEWQRQDPGFPDAIFVSDEISPTPGIEVKAWFPLATEITARFKNSQKDFSSDNIYVLLLAWLPEHLIYGKPKVVDMILIKASEIAKSRDEHYNNPPDYIVLEPFDTSDRTVNLQQTNTEGYKFQDNHLRLNEAQRIVDQWDFSDNLKYSLDSSYQIALRSLLQTFNYRLDTNYAKLNRIQNADINGFKENVYNSTFFNKKISEWKQILNSKNLEDIKNELIDNNVISRSPEEDISDELID